jgi:hypothetical protein
MPKKRKSSLKLNRQTIKELSPQVTPKLPGGAHPESVLVPCPNVNIGGGGAPGPISGEVCHRVQSLSCGRPCPSDPCR